MAQSGEMSTTAEVMAHLASGNTRQQDAYYVLQSSGLLEILADYHPYPAGTVPIDIDIPGSDLDLLCYAEDLDVFEAEMYNRIGAVAEFQCVRGGDLPDQRPYVTCNLQVGHWPVEIFAQSVPVNRQNAYLHMIVEWRLLQLWGDAGHREIRRLKQAGWKTEPAFASVLGLQGDPYLDMLHLAEMKREDLWNWARSRTFF
ncbi:MULTISPECIES: DUF4269 domain-containing protein [Paenibacillus]|uniref:DUF4269 domain-containing protein n=2 Tax=Paenibacillus TaxID=44249 RepID=UPI000B86B9B1|nr:MULTISPECIES: DUF4269 domain-containing protein [Paenibacillus]PRA09212.1 DUF4269 domain-containing protein [Paenibacillus sp. MYb63]PRA45966.1 DUF4269 domain-containing protein [Paenibacillus sp. MYb67]QZN73439.1 DUF4269 domain-containing protein [Paenibacillus sp. DR312]